MTPAPSRGDVWLADVPGDKLRPVVVMTRSGIVPYLHSVVVAPVTTTIRGIPTEVPLSAEEGLLLESVANLDNLQLLARARLRRHIGVLSAAKLDEVCRALRYAVAC